MARARTPQAAKKMPRPGAAESAYDLLDKLLPVADPSVVEVHRNAAVLEVGDPAQLLELAADTALRPFLLCRLAERVALIDPTRAPDLIEALRRRGHTPKIQKS